MHQSATSAKIVKITSVKPHQKDPPFTKGWGPRDPILSKPSANTEQDRKTSINMFRLRSGNENLNYELNRRLLCDSAICPLCGLENETVENFFIKCTYYNELCLDMCDHNPLETWTLNSILHGSLRYTPKQNLEIQKYTNTYIRRTGRFSWTRRSCVLKQ